MKSCFSKSNTKTKTQVNCKPQSMDVTTQLKTGFDIPADEPFETWLLLFINHMWFLEKPNQ